MPSPDGGRVPRYVPDANLEPQGKALSLHALQPARPSALETGFFDVATVVSAGVFLKASLKLIRMYAF